MANFTDYILTMENGTNVTTHVDPIQKLITDSRDSGQSNQTISTSTMKATTTSQMPSSTSSSSLSPYFPTSSSGMTVVYPAEDVNMAPMGLLAILILAVMGNITVCMVVKLDRQLHSMTYYFFVSMAVVHLLMVAVVMPPAILVILAGK